MIGIDPPHEAMTVEHNAYVLMMQTAEQGAAEIATELWANAAERAKAIETGSIWTARIVLPGCAGILVRAAADEETARAALVTDVAALAVRQE